MKLTKSLKARVSILLLAGSLALASNSLGAAVYKAWSPLASSDSIFSTLNGSTWSSRSAGPAPQYFDVCFVDSLTGWMVGNSGAIGKTTDGGLTWVKQLSPACSQDLWCVKFLNHNIGLIAGVSGTLLRTTDGGATWQTVSAGTSLTLTRVYFTAGGTAWLGGYGGTLLKSIDSGQTWTAPASPPLPSNHVVMDFSFVDENHGWLDGWYITGGAIVMKTTDGGVTWSDQSPIANDLHGVAFRNLDTGFVVGYAGLLSTYDGGSTWAQVDGSTLFGVRFADSQTGWAVGNGGAIRKTTNGGVNWSIQASGTTGNFARVAVWSQGCCQGKRGNVNCTGIVDLGDLTALVSYLTGGGFVLCCIDAANVNGLGTIDLGDLSALVSYLTGGGFVLPNCP